MIVSLRRKKDRDSAFLAFTRSICPQCKQVIDAHIVTRDGRVYMQKRCPPHGQFEVEISSDADYYVKSLSYTKPGTVPLRFDTKVQHGCPLDCGLCEDHLQHTCSPILEINDKCDLTCPVCIVRNQQRYGMSMESFKTAVDRLVDAEDELPILLLSGGEPTLHPDLPGLLEMCREAGIERLTISTNGLRLRDETLVRRLAELEARIVLSLDTFHPDTDRALLGANTVAAKLQVLDLLEKHNVTVTILPAIAAGYNDSEVGRLLHQVLTRPNILSLELHTLCFTGQGGVGFNRGARITIPDLHRRIDEATQGRITANDFVPSPLAHPHCYSICYLLCLDDGGYVPFTRLISRAVLFDLLSDSLYIEPREKLERVFLGVVDRLWAEPDACPESERVLRAIKRLLNQLFPPGVPTLSLTERRRIAERSAKAIYIHSHMDEETFDAGRVMKCCVGVPAPDGTNIPTCSYNVLYREKDPRFAAKPMLDRMRHARLQEGHAP